MKIRRAAITGATGPLGMALASHLAEQGVAVTAIVNPASKRIGVVPVSELIEVVACDLAALPSLRERVGDGYDAFFHFGWSATENRAARNNPTLHACNILYTLDAVKLAHDLGCAVFVGAGSQSEFRRADAAPAPDRQSVEESYGIAKYAAGRLSLHLCSQLGLRHCWGRVLSIYGPGERETTALMYCIHTLLRGERPLFTKGEQLWDYLYSGDCARAMHLIAARGHHGTAYDVGSGEARPLREYFETIRDAIDSSLPLGLGAKEYPPGQPMRLCADISLLREHTGFTPQVPFAQGIRETIQWVRSTVTEDRR